MPPYITLAKVIAFIGFILGLVACIVIAVNGSLHPAWLGWGAVTCIALAITVS